MLPEVTWVCNKKHQYDTIKIRMVNEPKKLPLNVKECFMELYDNLTEFSEFALPGGEKIRVRYRHDDYDVSISSEVAQMGDGEGKASKDYDEAALLTAKESIHKVDEKIMELLSEREKLVYDYLLMARAEKMASAGAAIKDIAVTDWEDTTPENFMKGKEKLYKRVERQNKVYKVVLNLFREPGNTQYRLTWQANPANEKLASEYPVDHNQKIPDYITKEDMYENFDRMQAKLTEKFFAMENPEIPRKYHGRLSVDGLPVPGYSYEE